jgi:leucyl/phenylalanyl-tRNA---protein transferase
MSIDGVLTPELILAAYRGGFFPMPDQDSGEIFWYNPDPRAIIPLHAFHVSRSLRRTARKQSFEVTFNQAFSDVIGACADRPQTWISPAIKDSYLSLFEMRHAHSVEVWSLAGGELVGGLYGVAQGGVFNAESMFSRARDASKIALWALVQRMRECQMLLLEVQFLTPHLASLGAINIKKTKYLQDLKVALAAPCEFKADPSPYDFQGLK